jgi:hypothetical protein
MSAAPKSTDGARPRPSPKGRSALFLLLAAAALVLAAAPARADLMISVGSATVAPGGAGAFDVTLSNPLGDTAVQLGGFTVALSVASGSGITLTRVDFPPTNYVFAGASFDQNFSLPLGAVTATTGSANDVTDPVAFVTLNPGSSFALARFSFSADAGLKAGTTIPLTLDTSA